MTFVDQSFGNSSIVRYALGAPRFQPRPVVLLPVTLFLASLADRRGPTSSGSAIAFCALAAAGAVIYRAWREDYQSPDDISRHIGTGARRLSAHMRAKVDEELRLHQALFSGRGSVTLRRVGSNLY